MGCALITGASSGIGYELSRLFAQDHHSLILVARRADRLNRIAAELAEAFGVDTIAFPGDLSKPMTAQKLYETIGRDGIGVDFLVNNAGFGVDGDFAHTAWDRELALIHLQTVSATQLVKLFLPDMLRSGRGRIMNVGSTGSFVPGPGNAVYCATKGYVLSLSEALAEELAGTGVTVTALCPGGTDTEFAQKAGARQGDAHPFGVMKARDVARIGYRGFMKGRRLIIPGLLNKMQVFGIRFLPRSMVTQLITHMMS